MPDMDLIPAAAALAVGLLAGAWLVRWRVRRRVARSRRLGREGEKAALRLLARAGYRVLGTEVVSTGRVVVDGEVREYTVRADALVRRWFRRYVVEFKGGEESARIGNRATRRQLLEYALVFDVSGVLLVDAVAGRIREVRFPGIAGR